LATLNQSSGNATGCSSTFNLSWTYDAWGNRTDQTVNSALATRSTPTVNTQNQLSGSPYQYDAAGNMTHDASHAYFYDAGKPPHSGGRDTRDLLHLPRLATRTAHQGCG